MSVNLIDSSDITVSQTNDDIELKVNDSVVEAFTGDLTNLTTTDKSSLVNAINEINENTEFEDFTSKVTFKEVVANVKFYRLGKIVHVQYQGEGKTHNANTTLATIPSAYLPSYQVVAPFTKNGNAYGYLSITSANGLYVGTISSTSVSGRIYANFTYYLD